MRRIRLPCCARAASGHAAAAQLPSKMMKSRRCTPDTRAPPRSRSAAPHPTTAWPVGPWEDLNCSESRRPGRLTGGWPEARGLTTPLICGDVGYGIAPPGKRTVNTEPLPGSLATVTSPPIMRASLRVMARPRPVPPNLCAVVASAWLNSSNSFAC
jgi:hypothetical protein